MSTQVVTGILTASDGRSAPLKTTLTDGSDSQGVGRFCDGWTLTHGYVQAATGIAYAYILRNGVNICNLTSISSKAQGAGYGARPLSHSVRIIPGDQLIVRTEA